MKYAPNDLMKNRLKKKKEKKINSHLKFKKLKITTTENESGAVCFQQLRNLYNNIDN